MCDHHYTILISLAAGKERRTFRRTEHITRAFWKAPEKDICDPTAVALVNDQCREVCRRLWEFGALLAFCRRLRQACLGEFAKNLLELDLSGGNLLWGVYIVCHVFLFLLARYRAVEVGTGLCTRGSGKAVTV